MRVFGRRHILLNKRTSEREIHVDLLNFVCGLLLSWWVVPHFAERCCYRYKVLNTSAEMIFDTEEENHFVSQPVYGAVAGKRKAL